LARYIELLFTVFAAKIVKRIKKGAKKIPAHSGKNHKQVLAFLALYGALLYSTGNMYNASVWKKTH